MTKTLVHFVASYRPVTNCEVHSGAPNSSNKIAPSWVGWAPTHRCEIWSRTPVVLHTVWWAGAHPTRFSLSDDAPQCKESTPCLRH
jgi:hypothetical protein